MRDNRLCERVCDREKTRTTKGGIGRGASIKNKRQFHREIQLIVNKFLMINLVLHYSVELIDNCWTILSGML